MHGDRPAICADLAEQQRLDEAPQIAHRVQVLQQRAQPEQLLHVARNVDVAVDVRLGEAELVQADQRPHAGLAADRGAEGGRPVGGPEAEGGAVPQGQLELYRRVGEAREESAPRPPRLILRRRRLPAYRHVGQLRSGRAGRCERLRFATYHALPLADVVFFIL